MTSEPTLALVLKATDKTAAGSTEDYLESSLRFTFDENGQDICLLQIDEEEEVGVMMGWERGLSKQNIFFCLRHR
jgi:type IV protein arginine methyltransferase